MGAVGVLVGVHEVVGAERRVGGGVVRRLGEHVDLVGGVEELLGAVGQLRGGCAFLL